MAAPVWPPFRLRDACQCSLCATAKTRNRAAAVRPTPARDRLRRRVNGRSRYEEEDAYVYGEYHDPVGSHADVAGRQTEGRGPAEQKRHGAQRDFGYS